MRRDLPIEVTENIRANRVGTDDIGPKIRIVNIPKARVNDPANKTQDSAREVELIDPAIQCMQVEHLFTEWLDTHRCIILSRDNKKTFFEDATGKTHLPRHH